MTGSGDDSGIVIRPASRQDVPLIRSFINELAEYERLTGDVVATDEVLSESLFEKRAAEVLIGEYDGKPAGFAVFFHNFSTFVGRAGIYLEDIYVKPALRGNGIGRALLAHMAKLAVARGCRRLEWAVLDWNEPAIGFYQKLGARALDEWTTYRLTGDALARLAGQ